MSGILTEMGVSSPEQAFNDYWLQYNFPKVQRASGSITVTSPRQSMFTSKENIEAARHFWKVNQLGFELENLQKAQRGELREKDLEHKTVDSTIVEGPTPLVFDPDVQDILKDEAPLWARTPEEGQRGYKAVYNRIDERDAPIGFVSESASWDLVGQSRNFGITRDETAMRIWVDEVETSEFAEAASAHYLNVRDTALGARLAEHAQAKERAILYAKPDEEIPDSGGIGSEHAYVGLSSLYQSTDKSSTDISGTQGLLKDVKAEIKDMLQGPYSVSKSDLEIWTSHTMFDELENQVDTAGRIQINDNGFDYGYEVIRVSGVPVFASHNVDEHEDTDGDTNTYTAGSEGDIFLFNRRSTRYRSLMPLSTIPLSKVGFSTRTGLGEFGALIERSGGNFGKYLSDYQI